MKKIIRDRDFLPTVLMVLGFVVFCIGFFLLSTVAGCIVTGLILVANGISLMTPAGLAEPDAEGKRVKEERGDE